MGEREASGGWGGGGGAKLLTPAGVGGALPLQAGAVTVGGEGRAQALGPGGWGAARPRAGDGAGRSGAGTVLEGKGRREGAQGALLNGGVPRDVLFSKTNGSELKALINILCNDTYLYQR